MREPVAADSYCFYAYSQRAVTRLRRVSGLLQVVKERLVRTLRAGSRQLKAGNPRWTSGVKLFRGFP